MTTDRHRELACRYTAATMTVDTDDMMIALAPTLGSTRIGDEAEMAGIVEDYLRMPESTAVFRDTHVEALVEHMPEDVLEQAVAFVESDAGRMVTALRGPILRHVQQTALPGLTAAFFAYVLGSTTPDGMAEMLAAVNAYALDAMAAGASTEPTKQ